ncbi:helix-turn-helix domain-containing protein [Bacteroides sp. 519]|uniref:winged helix-turn-helix transcriptional regulator n=1 Tax=Bacteroides sp. 519 TaxID=2302937 RepID=UPI00194028BA|nr:helix-turn-helix domain-containing protein [Bacteroides sp. 519]
MELDMIQQEKRSDCPFAAALEIWGDRWSLLIIRDIFFFEKKTYGEFLKSPEGISTNILAARLQQLEENGMIKKSEHPESKAKILYKPTQKAIDLIPVFAEIYLWVEHYYPLPDTIRQIMDIFKRDKQEAIRSLTEKATGML